LKWYAEEAIWNKWVYYVLSFIGMLCPLVNAVFVVLVDCKVVTIILSSIVSLSTSLLALTNARLKWENYRTEAEFLKKEYVLFQAKVGDYGTENRTSIYLCKIENSMQEVHKNWEKTFNKKEETQSAEDSDNTDSEA
jgi:hypothetical protein